MIRRVLNLIKAKKRENGGNNKEENGLINGEGRKMQVDLMVQKKVSNDGP